MLVFPVNSGMNGIGAVSVLPIRTEVASDHWKIALPLMLDPLHRRVHGGEFKLGPGIFMADTCDNFTLLPGKRRVLKLRAEDDRGAGGVVRTRIRLQKNRQRIADRFHSPRAAE